jgi:peptidoglycan/xylan/chitin deacetylase (PgdA/CDA1 family)
VERDREVGRVSATIPILTFHRVDRSNAVTAFSPELFASGMAGLYDLGYRTLSLAQAVGCLGQKGDFPDKSIAITFDDGYESAYLNAFPVLQRYGLTATVFLVAGDEREIRLFAGCERLSASQVREMSDYGIVFGAHTVSHPDLTRLPADRVETEMRESKEKIEQMLGQAVLSFAYPFGASNRLTRELARRYFDCACTDNLGIVGAKSDPWALERVDAYYLRAPRLFALLASSVFPAYVRACNIPRRFRRAVLTREA